MRLLAKCFINNGEEFNQIKREGDIAIYKRTKLADGSSRDFEVIKIAKHDGSNTSTYGFSGPAELYPSSEQWGTFGFTATSIEDAEKRFRALATGL